MAVEVSGAVERFTAGMPKMLFPVSAKSSQYQQPGLKSMISGPFFIALVAVGCRWMVLGPSLGTLAGTLEPTPMCAYRAHIVLR